MLGAEAELEKLDRSLIKDLLPTSITLHPTRIGKCKWSLLFRIAFELEKNKESYKFHLIAINSC
jgi:hypothetical protein